MSFLLLIILISIALPIYVIGYPIHLSGKIKKLQLRVELLERQAGSRSVDTVTIAEPVPPAEAEPLAYTPPMSKEAATAAPMMGVSAAQQQSAAMAYSSSAPDDFIAWIKKDFMVKLGAVLLLLATIWFVSYAFENNWIGPAGRITLGILFGIAVMGVGTWRIRTQLHQGGIFVALGATAVQLTIYAARNLYDFFTPGSSLLLMFAVVVFVAFVSVRYRSKGLAMGGLILAGLAPMLTDAPDVSVVGLNVYLLVVVLGTLWVVFITRWSELTLAALILTYLYGMAFLDVSSPSAGEQDVALLFSLVFIALYFISNIASMRLFGVGEQTSAHILTVLGTGIYLFTWVIDAVSPEWQSLMFVVWALVFSLGTYFVYIATQNRAIFFVYTGISVALIGAATAAELEGSVLTIALMIEIGLLIVAGALLKFPTRIVAQLSLLLFVPFVMTFPSIISRSWDSGIIHNDFMVLLLFTLLLLTVGVFLSERNPTKDELISHISVVMLAGGGTYATVLVWLSLHALLAETVATTLALVIYTVSGITFYVLGHRESLIALRIAGGALIGLVLVRLLFIDVWDMPLAGRVVTFFVIGILLVSTAFMGKLLQPKNSSVIPENN